MIKRKYIPKFKSDYILLFSLMNIITGYSYAVEPENNNPSINKFYSKFSNLDGADIDMVKMWIIRNNIKLRKNNMEIH